MSEHARSAPVPFFTDGPTEAPRPIERVPSHDWPLALVLLGGVIVSYAVVLWAIYVTLTALI